jgi:vitamin B12 transporter
MHISAVFAARRTLRSATVFAALQLLTQQLRAQAPAQVDAEARAGASAAPGVIAPRVVFAPEIVFPEDALAAGAKAAAVVLKVTVGVDGQLTDIHVLEGAGPSFDEQALSAAMRYRFEPARRGERAVASRILLTIAFNAPATTVTETAPVTAPVTAPAAAPDSESTSAQPLDVTVKGEREAERLRHSAAAVHVIETDEAKRRTADLGEVLARSQGVGVQRSGGLGSDARLSLNGLTDDQIRFFIDGVPLDFMGFPFGPANVPVNLVERVEIYRGVVPLRFGADALGGAVNLVSDQSIRPGLHGSSSVQAGSFGTYRVSLGGHRLDASNGVLVRVSSFYDHADNDYPMHIDVVGPSGREEPGTVYRFHDGYRALGGSVEAGVLDKPWARRFLVRAFATRYDKEIQHNLQMGFYPYGDVELAEFVVGASARYEHALARGLSLKSVAGYVNRTARYTDIGECFYNWFGQCFRDRSQPGERTGRAQDQDYWQHNAFGRAHLEWHPAVGHALRTSLSPTFTSMVGRENRLANREARDPLSAQRSLYGLVSGVEYEADLFDAAIENILFIKDYLQVQRSEDPLSNGRGFRRADRTTHRLGMGDSLRYTLTDWAYTKASYEWATRLPRADELFGNAFPIQPNLGLQPELSHNVNVGITIEGLQTAVGELRADLNGFARDAQQLITLQGDDQAATYQNVYNARSLGVETAAGWTSERQYVALDGNLTYVDFRNTSSAGAYEDYAGQRIPNRPYLFANSALQLTWPEVTTARDKLSLIWSTRYVQAFLRAWEGIGVDKLDVPAQLLHALALSYLAEGDVTNVSFTGEAQNLTDAPAFDMYGIPKPGRAFYFKATLSL